jgi:protoheme IX farnesyltransferase
MTGRRVLLERLAVATLVCTFVLICVGAYVVTIGAGEACPTWPQCFPHTTSGSTLLDKWFPFVHASPDGTIQYVDDAGSLHRIGQAQVAAEWIHRFLAGVVSLLTVATIATIWRLRPARKGLRVFGAAAGVLLVTQIGLGGVTVLGNNAPWTVVLHQANAMLVLSSMVVVNVLVFTTRTEGRGPSARDDDVPSGKEPGPMTSRPWTAKLQQKLGPWVELVKPGILFLLVLCGAAAMFLAGRPSLRLVAATLLGGALAAGSAAALNNYFDRERDAKMKRTARRSVPSGRVAPAMAVVFALALELASFAILWRYANLLTAALALAGIVFYVYYTIWLKPTTAQNIVIGGAAGAAPALVGWAAVRGDIGLPAALLGFIIFAWTPPHFWALALVYKKDYEEAAVPMLPVVAGEETTRKQILVYAVLTVLATLAFVPLGVLGLVYGAAALALGGWFVYLAAKLVVRKDNKTAYGLFAYSIVYLGLLFAAMVADRLVH